MFGEFAFALGDETYLFEGSGAVTVVHQILRTSRASDMHANARKVDVNDTGVAWGCSGVEPEASALAVGLDQINL